MSYCRFSTNDFRCDVYVYASRDGWVIHVARNKSVLPDDMPDEPDLDDVDAWVKHMQLIQGLVQTSRRVPLDLGHDGETFVLPSPGECADKLAMLAECGYRMPPRVVTDLREEQEALDA